MGFTQKGQPASTVATTDKLAFGNVFEGAVGGLTHHAAALERARAALATGNRLVTATLYGSAGGGWFNSGRPGPQDGLA